LGLGAEARAERLAEVNSDLWEHALDDDLNGVAASGTAQEMLFRLVSGMPADVAWRFEQRSPVAGGKDMLALVQKNSWQRNSLWGLSFLLIGFLLVTGVGIAIGMESSLAVKLAYGSAVFSP
jgi:hypothetical protein